MSGDAKEFMDSFGLRKIQDVKAFLIESERGGIRTVPDLLYVIDMYINKKAWEGNRSPYRVRPSQKQIPVNICPSCGHKHMHMGKVIEGVTYNGCPKCRYSEVV